MTKGESCKKVQGIILERVATMGSPDAYLIIVLVIGLAALGMAWMPAFTKATGISYAILYVAAGAALYLALGRLLPLPDPISKNNSTLRLTEMVVLVSLMGSGLKIDMPFSLRRWRVPLRLVSLTMVLSIGIVALIGYYILGFSLPAAILMGAVLAPTDPVLASDVQVGPPGEGDRTHVKFALTAEAGMNDGTAFPFTWLAIGLATDYIANHGLGNWFAYELLYKIVAGVGVGFIVGRLLAWVLFRLPQTVADLKVRDGFIALSVTLVVYGLTEMIHGYGFIAVFIAAITIRNYERHHKFHKMLHEFTDQIERILVAIVLLLFGGSLVTGLLDKLTWPLALFAIVFVLFIRPLTGLISLWGRSLHIKEKLAIGFFGIKGIGSFYYLAFALQQTFFAENEELWALGGFTVLLSIIVHGLTATPVMKRLEVQFAKSPVVMAEEAGAKV